MSRCVRCDRCAMRDICFAAAHRATHTREQFFGAKGFCNVVVRAEFQKQDLVLDVCVGAQYDDGD